MSWAEQATSKAALEAGKLSDPAVRELALVGLEELATVTDQIERRAGLQGARILHSVKDRLWLGDVEAAKRLASTGDPLDQAIGLLDGAIARARTENAEAIQAAEDWQAIWDAVERAGIKAGRIALTLLLMAAGI